MGKVNASKRIEGGKFLQVEFNFNGQINDITIKGDFFMHPEESIWGLEKCLDKVQAEESRVRKQIEDYISENNVALAGITPEDITQCIMNAVDKSDTKDN